MYKQNNTEKDERLHLPLLQKGDHRITENLRGITLTAIATKVYNALLLNCIGPEVEKLLEKLERLSEKSIHNLTHSDYTSNHRRSMCKKCKDNTIVRKILQGI